MHTGGSSGPSAWPQNRSLSFQIWREDKLMSWARCGGKEPQLLFWFWKLVGCQRNRVGWSHSLRKALHSPLKPERRPFFVRYVFIRELFSQFEMNNVPDLPLNECPLI